MRAWRLESRGTREQTAVDGVNDGLSSDLLSAEEASVQAFDGVFATLDAVELEIDVALGGGV